ncbi:rab3 GTPase-activating protein catalytic subunit-like isoform X1 [Notothenia coriiceps]|uniref:Rab3 GTPase-activating protein catalytic subunit-like isoform X1 n=2 Tax=Nototheniidae TaxID=8206 RepID=A0A6I9NSS7_9TELE|nr:PREDICTED: rab3 GTPase-activating protein catalytic subunit-like isoform X1 [Notothenia coriiceps]
MALETAITQARSLKAKFATCEGGTAEDTEELEKFVSSLLEDPEVVVLGAGQGPAGSIIHRLFINSQRLADFTSDEAALLSPMEDEFGLEKKPGGGSNKVPDFPPPAGREILLRTCVPRPAPYSKALPQRLFCVLMKEEFRLAGAFSSDTTFF